MIYLLTLSAAFCSILYELVLAQTLSAVMGNTMLRYSSTIGLFLLALGLGSFLYQNYKHKNPLKLLFKVEVALCFLGYLSPHIIVMGDALLSDIFYQQSGLSLTAILSYLLNYSLIVLIGVLSGIELPALMSLAEKSNKNSGGKVLATDYLGTFAGAILFSLWLLPSFGIFSIAAGVAILNGLLAWIIFVWSRNWIPFLSRRDSV